MFLAKIFLCIAVSIIPLFGMSYLQKLSLKKELRDERQARTVIRRLDALSRHTICTTKRTWSFLVMPDIECDQSGDCVRSYCIDKNQKIYPLVYDIRQKKEMHVDEDIQQQSMI